MSEPYCYLCGGAHELAACRPLELEAMPDDPAIETLEHGQTALPVDGEQRTLPGIGAA